MSDKEIRKKTASSMAVATLLVMLGSILSKGSGFARDILVGMKFHTDLYRDAYSTSFMFPDFFYNLLIGGSIQAAVTPSLAAAISKKKEKEGLKSVSVFISVFSVLMAVVCILGTIFSRQLFNIYAPKGADPETIELAAKGARLLFVQIFFMMFAALSIGILNAYKRFGSTSFGPTIYNICVVLSIAIFAGDSASKLQLCMAGIMCSALIYFVFQYVVGFDKLKRIRPCFDIHDKGFKTIVIRAVPILISASTVQINVMTISRYALEMGQGVKYALNNATTVWQLPYGIFAFAVGNVMLPSLAGLYASKDYKGASKLLSSRLKTALFMTIPSALFLFMMSYDTIEAVFKWNSTYTDDNIHRAGIILMGYSFAVIIHTGVFMFNQAFYAIGRTFVPLISGVLSIICVPAFCTIFKAFGLGMISLSISYSLTALIQLILLASIYCMNKKLAPRGILPFLVKCAICLITMGLALFILNWILPEGQGKIVRLGILAVKGIVSILVYFSSACLIRMEEALFWIRKVTSRLGKKA